jgi:aminoglycoside phosphotransferase (APT) family kinase protein
VEPEQIRQLDEILAAYLRHKLPAVEGISVDKVERSTGGASRSQWFFDARWEGEAAVSKQLTLRTSECTCFRDEESSIEREYRIYKSLERSPVPVPTNYFYEDDPRWLGRPFVIRERLEGTTAFVGATPEQQQRIVDQLIEVLAAQHLMDWDELGLSFLGAPEPGPDCALHLVDQWENVIRREQLEPSPLLTAAARWLRHRSPRVVDRISLCQGQVGPGQMLVRGDQLVGSLDWESAFLGDPMSDIAYLEYMLRPSMGDYVDQLLARYCDLTGLPIRKENIRFYLVFNSFWVTAICLAGRRRVASGEMPKLQTSYVGISIPQGFMMRIAQVLASDRI